MSGQVSRGSAGDYQADERAGVTWQSWRLSGTCDNHDGVITQLEPDILECEIKWALGSITTKKLVEVMEF